MLIDVILLIIAFIVIWFSTEFAIASIDRLTHHNRLSRLTFSLFVIGIITSFPEIAVTASSALLRSPQIALGNLIGSQIFLLFLVIPVLAIVSKGLQLHAQMKNVSLIFTLVLALLPIFALLNQSINMVEIILIIAGYALFALFFYRQTFLERISVRIQKFEPVSVKTELLKLMGMMGVLFLASHVAVREMVEISSILETPRFLFSMLILPIGTNLPELSFAFNSLKSPRKDFALGDYMGSLIFNSLLIALLALGSGGNIMIGQNISYVVIAFVVGVIAFWYCCFSQEILSIKEGLLLLLCYFILLSVAVWQIMSGILG